jgi:hypothetical protein
MFFGNDRNEIEELKCLALLSMAMIILKTCFDNENDIKCNISFQIFFLITKYLEIFGWKLIKKKTQGLFRGYGYAICLDSFTDRPRPTRDLDRVTKNEIFIDKS